MLDKTPQADRILIAELTARQSITRGWRELTEDEHEAAVGELRKLAGGRSDLLAYVAGILEGFCEGGPDEATPRRAAALCRSAGADEALIPEWVEIGRQRRADARQLPFSGGLRPG